MSAPADAAVARTSRSLDQLVDVETPEQVLLSYTIAGVGSRAAAAVIDYLICFGVLFALGLLWQAADAALPRGAGAALSKAAGAWMVALFVAVQFAILWGYYVVFEGMFDGQTPGKKQLGLRVVQDGGYSVTFAASAVRNLVRILDMQPLFLYGVGVATAAASRSGKRLGDMAAGTIVVRERVQHVAPVAAAAGAAAGEAAAVSALLTDEEFALLERYVARRADLDPERRRVIGEGLARRFLDRVPEEPAPTPAMLIRLFEREKAARARGVAARSDTGASREQHAIVALGTPRWAAFAALLTEAQRRGLRAMSEREVSEFVAQYRELATDLARLRTAARGREVEALFYLSRLVAGGHNLLYRQRQLAVRSTWRYLTVTVPREVRRSWRPIVLAGVLFFGPAAIAYAAVVRRPVAAAEFIPAGMIDRAEQGVVRKQKGGEGYVDDPELLRPIWASRIIANNVQVTFAALAGGMTAGVLTVLLLVTNGIFLGGVHGLYVSKGIGDLLLAFVAPHGVLELTAITIAGGGGLLIASALLLPGAQTRREALVVRGRRAIRLIAASTLLLVIAGAIEGFISPRETWPLADKLAVAGGTAVFLLFYLALGRGRLEEGPGEEHGYREEQGSVAGGR